MGQGRISLFRKPGSDCPNALRIALCPHISTVPRTCPFFFLGLLRITLVLKVTDSQHGEYLLPRLPMAQHPVKRLAH